jgi:hypothetical protein
VNPGALTGNNDVGISLMAGEEADAIVDVLRDKLGDRLRVSDHAAYVKVETDTGALEIALDEVAEILGRPFTMSDFHVVFASFYGRPHVTEERVGIYSDMAAGVIDPPMVAGVNED